MNLKKYFTIDPLKSFIELPILWIFVGIPILVAVIIAIVIAKNSSLVFSFNYIGFNSLTEIFKVPIAVIAISITFAAFIATIHRSAQTREQIIITNKQNTFSNYYKHIDEFEKYVATTFDKNYVKFSNPRIAHKYLFPDAIDGNYFVNNKFLHLLEAEYTVIQNQLAIFNHINDQSIVDIFFVIYTSFDKVLSPIDMRIFHPNCRQYVKDGNRILIPDFNLRGAFSVIKRNTDNLERLLLFEQKVVLPKVFVEVSKINYTGIPEWSFETKSRIDDFDVYK